MSHGFFCERTEKPSPNQIATLLGKKAKQWSEIDAYLVETKGAKPASKFYGRNYGWALGYSKSGKSIISLFPLENDFTVQMIVKKAHEAAIRQQIDNTELLSLIKKTRTIHEGKWVFIKFSVLNSVEIVQKLIDIRMG